jgi:hypothetical protein
MPSAHPRYRESVLLTENGPISWHDGRIISFRFIKGLSAIGSNDLELIADIYPIFEFPHPSDLKRIRYKVIGQNTERISFNGDLKALKKHASIGNIDHMRLDFENGNEVLNLSLFGGSMIVEATTFLLSELKKSDPMNSNIILEQQT